MGEIYDNPPLLEVVCEFHFQESHPWNPVFAEYIHDRVKLEFPLSRPRRDIEVKIDERGVTQQLSEPKTLLIREDERALLQVAPNLLTVNHLKPYPAWNVFRKMIENAFNTYVEVAKPKEVKRIGLRYINRVEVPSDEQGKVKIEDYLNVFPKTPDGIPDTFVSWGQRVEIPFLDINGLLILQTASVRENTAPSMVIFIIDLDFVTSPMLNISVENALKWVEKAHEQIEVGFESCITDKTRGLFGSRGHI
jgi:uncharacterized protein (TIGR04255 family)